MEGRIEIYFVKELDGRCEVRVSKEHKPHLVVSKMVDLPQLRRTILSAVAEVLRLDVD